ncbi:nuclear receptor 2C2-associated protein-like [Centruroides sculpturatus]|uniref:nuclear receptor 2C2-associated protein-like n=1 Tax=Centruroides sculpturatus TaxID=218467 RepID=UPI000C6D2C3F|nr:nuclear receptor 2C2-associated protein-like [Centruroides sculpturatus]
MVSIINSAEIRVSSVLNRNVKQFGKAHMLDGQEDTCWNSDQGSPQWIYLKFSKCVVVREIHLQFQGGFVGKDCYIETGESTKYSFYPEDNNRLQVFKFNGVNLTDTLKIMFESSTDFFGRITVYKLDVISDDDNE